MPKTPALPTPSEIDDMSPAEIVAAFNDLAPRAGLKPVKRFENRVVGAKRLDALVAHLIGQSEPEPVTAARAKAAKAGRKILDVPVNKLVEPKGAAPAEPARGETFRSAAVEYILAGLPVDEIVRRLIADHARGRFATIHDEKRVRAGVVFYQGDLRRKAAKAEG